jgi:hypothetical protein
MLATAPLQKVAPFFRFELQCLVGGGKDLPPQFSVILSREINLVFEA